MNKFNLPVTIGQIIKHNDALVYFAVISTAIRHPEGGFYAQYVPVVSLDHKGNAFKFCDMDKTCRSSSIEYIQANFTLTNKKVLRQWAVKCEYPGEGSEILMVWASSIEEAESEAKVLSGSVIGLVSSI